MTRESQTLRINIFENPSEVVVVAAMPGIEPEDIAIDLDGAKLSIAASGRGADAEKKYLSQEWSYGPYARELELATPVNGGAANASYGNGVLTIVLPKAPSFAGNHIRIPKVGQARGLHLGSPP